MAALEYIQLPVGARRLRALSQSKPTDTTTLNGTDKSSIKSSSTGASSNSNSNSKSLPPDIRPAPQVYTSLPNPSPPSSPAFPLKRRPSLLLTPAGATAALSSPVLSLIPQMLMAGSLPSGNATTPTSAHSAGSTTAGTGTDGGPGSAGIVGIGVTPPTPTTGTSSNPRRKIEAEPVTLLSSKDPLSLPIMSTNFRRFVSIVGPVFWLQDRIEEIVLWKRGWLRTVVWMAGYTFLCFYPRMIFMLPHVALIAVILATYPYPPRSPDTVFSLDSLSESSKTAPAPAPPAVEGSVPWQANIQGIQNLMGATADAHDLIEPYLYHLNLTPAHLSTTRLRTGPGTAFSTHYTPNARSPYTAHILTILLVSFFPLLFLISLPIFPIREVCIFAGLFPFFVTHPLIRPVLPHLIQTMANIAPIALAYAKHLQERVVDNIPPWLSSSSLYRSITRAISGSPSSSSSSKTTSLSGKFHVIEEDHLTENDDHLPPVPLGMVVQRVIDNDRLSDECWEADMREVELWENERYGGSLVNDLGGAGVGAGVGGGVGPISASSSSSSASSAGGAVGGVGTGGGVVGGIGALAPQKGWSKANLRPGERAGWTRGRDGSNAVGGVDGSGDVSSNLTFALAPGWSFVESEDWRKDVRVAWSGCSGDPDGWVYTNDSWLGSRPAPYTSGGGSVTRRRRWIRRVWYDPARARAER